MHRSGLIRYRAQIGRVLNLRIDSSAMEASHFLN